MRANWLSPWLLVFSLAVAPLTTHAEDSNWALFKQNYLGPGGRIVDKDNHGISHSEGQGYGMLLAVINDDPATFDKLWQWTRKTLLRPSLWLFAWRYEPSEKAVTDDNNATDGDTLIAWALLLAGNQWHKTDYLQASSHIQEALIRSLIVEQGRDTLLLPGLQGFSRNNGYVINPSYFIFPAWESFYQQSHNDIWLKLKQSSLSLLDNARFGKTQLPSDWLFINSDGEMTPAEGWPARFSYDAIRIPLYLSWGETPRRQTAIFRHFWENYDRNFTPAWIEVSGDAQANYPLSGGMLSVRDLTMGDIATMEKSLQREESYYLSVLHMLALHVATQKSHSPLQRNPMDG